VGREYYSTGELKAILARVSIDIIFHLSYTRDMSSKLNSHAKALSRAGASKGGHARAQALTPQERSSQARKAVLTRWAKEKGIPLKLMGQTSGGEELRATHTGTLKIQSINIPCYVLENGERVISGRGLQNAFGYSSSAAGTALARELVKLEDRTVIEAVDKRVSFKRPGAGGSAEQTFGYRAEILVDICDVLLEYRKHHQLTEIQESLAHRAETLTRAFAKVGVIALIDEATGYTKAKDEYQKILEQYLAPEIRPWIKTFDEEYYKELYRLLGWDWDAFRAAKKKTHSRYIGWLTNRIVYEKLAPGVLEALKELNPKDEKGNRSHKYHQDLSDNIGYIRLVKHLASVTTIMEQYPDRDLKGALHKIDSRFPTLKVDFQLALDFPAPIDSDVSS
jgi:hypothetical protein